MSFSENLKVLRKSTGVSQGVLSEAVDVSIKTVSHWETGYSEPSISQLIVIADFFDVSIDDLVDRK
jgi:transcriptional regulator with XRE-family HTH domain